MKRKLSKGDQEKLDEYFTGVRQVELGLERQAKWADVAKPKAPFDGPDEGVSGEDAIKLNYDMMLIALQTDATRVVTYRLRLFRFGMGETKSPFPSHYKPQPRTELLASAT